MSSRVAVLKNAAFRRRHEKSEGPDVRSLRFCNRFGSIQGETNAPRRSIKSISRVRFFGVLFELERLLGDALNDGVATQALGAHAHRLGTAVRKADAHVLKIRLEVATGDAGDFRTDALQMLRATASRNVITNDFTFAANFANSRHDNSYFLTLQGGNVVIRALLVNEAWDSVFRKTARFRLSCRRRVDFTRGTARRAHHSPALSASIKIISGAGVRVARFPSGRPRATSAREKLALFRYETDSPTLPKATRRQNRP